MYYVRDGVRAQAIVWFVRLILFCTVLCRCWPSQITTNIEMKRGEYRAKWLCVVLVLVWFTLMTQQGPLQHYRNCFRYADKLGRRRVRNNQKCATYRNTKTTSNTTEWYKRYLARERVRFWAWNYPTFMRVVQCVSVRNLSHWMLAQEIPWLYGKDRLIRNCSMFKCHWTWMRSLLIKFASVSNVLCTCMFVMIIIITLKRANLQQH